jgi:hypothetical protein
MEQQEKQNTSEPHVQIFGEEIDSRKEKREKRRECNCYHHRHYDGGNLLWGSLVLLAGVALLLNYLGILSWQFWNFILPFWPILLVLLGIRIIFGRNWVSSLIVFLVGLAILAAIIIYGLMQIHSPLTSYFPPDLVNFINSLNQLKQ